MTLTLFTSNQPRHQALIETLAALTDRLWVIQECNTVFPGQVQDFFNKSPVMQDYFSRVIEAERRVFGPPRFTPDNARALPIKMGDLKRLTAADLKPALSADLFVVFGASYIQGELCDALVERQAINIHMGLSPWYRGSSTNFWAMYDGRPERVGATIHRLTRGLDSGPMLFHALPAAAAVEPFEYGMRAVQAAHQGLAEAIQSGRLPQLPPVEQDKSKQLRYTRNADFTDAVAEAYLRRLPTPQALRRSLEKRDPSELVRPFILK